MVSRTQTETEVKYYIKWMPLLYSVQKNWFIVHVYMYYYIFMTNKKKKKHGFQIAKNIIITGFSYISYHSINLHVNVEKI